MSNSQRLLYSAAVWTGMILLGFLGTNSTVQAGNWEVIGQGHVNADIGVGDAVNISLDIHPNTGEPYVAFMDSANPSNIFVKRFNGTQWESLGQVGKNAGFSTNVSLMIDPVSLQPYVAYGDEQQQGKITVKRFNGTAWEVVGVAGLSTGRINNISLSFHPTTKQPYIAYGEQVGSAPYRATVKRFDGSVWQNVGNTRFSSGRVNMVSLAFHPDTNEPFVAFKSRGGSVRVHVKKLVGNKWQDVLRSSPMQISKKAKKRYNATRKRRGTNGVNTTVTDKALLAFNPTTKQPYVAYVNELKGDKSIVRRYDGRRWRNVTISGLTIGHTFISSFAFHRSTSEPYLAFQDASNHLKATVKKLNTGGWQAVGNAGFSANQANKLALDLSPNGDLFTAHLDASYDSGIAVMQYVENPLPNNPTDPGQGDNPDDPQGGDPDNPTDPQGEIPIVITGVTNGAVYETNVTPVISGGVGALTITLNASPFVSGTEITQNGLYTLIATDSTAESVTYSFRVAKPIGITDPNSGKIETEISNGNISITGTSGAASQAIFNSATTLQRGNHQLLIPRNTLMTKNGGGTFNMTGFTLQDQGATIRIANDHTVVAALKIGIVGERLNFNQAVMVTMYVGAQYNGDAMTVLYRNEGESDWLEETTCVISDGACEFTTNHATDYAAQPEFNLSNGEDVAFEIEVQDTALLACSDTVNFGTLIAGIPQTQTSDCSVTTNADLGYDLKVKKDASTTMIHEDTVTTIADKTAWDPSSNAGAGNAATWNGTGLGFTVVSSGGTKNTTWWGTGTTATDPLNKYAGFPTTYTTITDHDTYSATPISTTVGYKLDVPSGQRSGAYNGTVTYQFVCKP